MKNRSLNDTLDEYMSLKHPQRVEEIRHEMKVAYDAALNGRTPEQVERDFDNLMAMAHQEYIKDGAPFTGAEIWELKKAKRERNRAKARPGDPYGEQRRVALLSFLEIDKVSGTSAEAINFAYDEVGRQCSTRVSKASIGRWLDDIISFTDIRKSKRGERGRAKK